MRLRCVVTVMAISVFLFGMTTGCRKKVAVAQPAPPPVQEAAPPPPATPTATLNAEPSTIEPGQTVTLKWSSANATEATISSVGSVPVEGKQDVQPAKSTTFELVVNGPGGTARASATVNVVAPPPPVFVTPPVEGKSLQERVETELSDAYFDYDKSEVREDALAILAKDADALRSILADFPEATIVVEGHCDERGSAEYNLGLGDRRVSSALEYLKAIGVPPGRLNAVSYGKERPQCTEQTESCWQSNRRVHFSAGASGTN
jgi:peptidoglycan-associated lipoprotein